MPATDAVQTIEPAALSRITAAPCLIARNGPIRFTRRTVCQSAALCSKNGVRPPPMPAFANTTSSPPSSRTQVVTSSFTVPSSAASALRARQRPPAFSISARVSSTPSARSTASTWAPSLANRIALARPMPLAAPVTSARFPKSLIANLLESVPARAVHEIAQRLAALEPAHVVDRQLHQPLHVLGLEAGQVRSQDRVRRGPDRVARRQRLALEHVECGAGEAAGPEALEQRAFV